MAALSLSLSLSLYLAAHPVHEILSWHENRRNDNGVGIKNTRSKMLDIILHTNQAKIFGISEKPLHAGKEEEEEGPKNWCICLFPRFISTLAPDSRTLSWRTEYELESEVVLKTHNDNGVPRTLRDSSCLFWSSGWICSTYYGSAMCSYYALR
jgi:hypothetical protein